MPPQIHSFFEETQIDNRIFSDYSVNILHVYRSLAFFEALL